MFNRRLIISMLYILLVGCGNQRENKTVEISLKTIQCGMCSNKIADGLNKLEGIKKIDVDLEKKVGTVMYNASVIDIKAIEGILLKAESSKLGQNSLIPIPAKRIGMVPIHIAIPRRAFGVCHLPFLSAILIPFSAFLRSVLKHERTAKILPSCITAVTATPGSSQPISMGIIFRWAVLLIGKNSVMPCTTARMAS